MEKGSKELIRDMNTSLILQTIVQHGTISRADLAKELKLSKATVSAIVQNLIERALIREVGSRSTEVGRKPILLEFRADSGFVLSMDVQNRAVIALLSDMAGRQYHFLTIPHHALREQIIPFLASLIRKMQSLVPESPHGIVGIALAIHGVVHDGQILFAPYYSYEGLDFSCLEETFQIPVYVENEANLAVLGEHAFGIPAPNLAALSIHSGVGLGLILKGQLFQGFRGFAGEFGHTTIEIGGRPCPCGNRGCLEQYLSERVLLAQYARVKHLPEVNVTTLCLDYQSKDPDAAELISQFLNYIAVSIHNIQNMINPERIVINSRITAALPDTLPLLLRMLPDGKNGQCSVSYSELQDRAVLLGGVCICIKHFLKIDLSNKGGR